MRIVEDVSWTVSNPVEWRGKLFEDGSATLKCGDMVLTGSRYAERGSKEKRVYLEVNNQVIKRDLPETVYVVSDRFEKVKHFAATMGRSFSCGGKDGVRWVDCVDRLRGLECGTKVYILGEIPEWWAKQGGPATAMAYQFRMHLVEDW